MARALWVTEEPPDRELGGGSIRQAHLLSALGRRVTTDLLLAGTLDDDITRASVATVVSVTPSRTAMPATRTARRMLDLRLAVLEPGPREAFLLRTLRGEMSQALDALDAESTYDLVIVNHQALTPLLRAPRRGRWVASLQNVAGDRALQTAAATPGRRQRWIFRREAAKATRLERWAVRAYDALVVCSAQDADALTGPDRSRSRGPVILAPNGVDVRRYVPTPLPPEPRLVMSATFNYLPNVDGAVWFVNEVLPLVRSALPLAVLDLVGRQPVKEVVALGTRPGVLVHPDVASVAPFLSAGRVAIVPLRMGTGTRLKALEAMAAGRPVAGTPIGLAGLGLVDGVHARLAADPPALASAIVELLTDKPAAQAMAEAGRRLVEEHFDWDRIGEDFVDALLALAVL